MKKVTQISANKPIGPQLKQLRLDRDTTIREQTVQMGLKSHSTIAHLEDGRVPDPRISSIINYAKALGYKRVEIEL